MTYIVFPYEMSTFSFLEATNPSLQNKFSSANSVWHVIVSVYSHRKGGAREATVVIG